MTCESLYWEIIAMVEKKKLIEWLSPYVIIPSSQHSTVDRFLIYTLTPPHIFEYNNPHSDRPTSITGIPKFIISYTKPQHVLFRVILARNYVDILQRCHGNWDWYKSLHNRHLTKSREIRWMPRGYLPLSRNLAMCVSVLVCDSCSGDYEASLPCCGLNICCFPVSSCSTCPLGHVRLSTCVWLV